MELLLLRILPSCSYVLAFSPLREGLANDWIHPSPHTLCRSFCATYTRMTGPAACKVD